MNLTPEEREVGRQNFHEALGVTRRKFLQGTIAAAVAGGAGLGAAYFGYSNTVGNPVRVGIIGTGDEGNVLIGGLNPDYIDVVAICDIRPSSIHRAFHGDWSGPSALEARPGLMSVYGYPSEDAARANIEVYQDYQDLLKNPNVEALIIALPLFLHAEVAIKAMQAGKHVLTEKLMGHTVGQCKDMSRVSQATGKLLATGHQRHYSVLYDNAQHVIKQGLIGQLHHIRAQWHRGNLPGKDSWTKPLPIPEDMWDKKESAFKPVNVIEEQLKKMQNAMAPADPEEAESLSNRIKQWEAYLEDNVVNPEKYGYQKLKLVGPDGKTKEIQPLEALIRWRVYDETGGGLMAELGSHQLDAASIFISAASGGEKKVKPLSVYAVGDRHIFPLDRDAADHVYCMFEFPAPAYKAGFDVGYWDPANKYPHPDRGVPGYDADPSKKIVLSYSSINGNGFGGYGEVVLGTKGTLILEKEKEYMLYRDADTSTKVSVKENSLVDAYETGGSAAVAEAAIPQDISRGYREEIEHFAWCIRNPDPANQPKCHPEIALADAVLALTAKEAIRASQAGKSGYRPFEPDWFDINSDATPDGSKPEQPAAGGQA